MDICITFSSSARNGAVAAVVSCDNGSRAGRGLLAGWRLTYIIDSKDKFDL